MTFICFLPDLHICYCSLFLLLQSASLSLCYFFLLVIVFFPSLYSLLLLSLCHCRCQPLIVLLLVILASRCCIVVISYVVILISSENLTIILNLFVYLFVR